MANRQQRRNKPKPIVYNPVNTDKLSMQAELKEKLSLATLIQLEKEVTDLVENAVKTSAAPVAEKVHKMDWAVVFRVLIDRFGFGKKRLNDLFTICNSYLQDVEEGSLNLDDMCNTLLHDDGIEILWNVDTERI